jgi:imidazoleglycerol-phosphate dehydratase
MTSYQGMRVEREADVYRALRETREARIEVALDFGAPRIGRTDTTISFFDHMLEQLGWYVDAAIDATYEVKTFRLTHVVWEDVGLALGATFAAVVRDRLDSGIDSNGAAHGVMDEASAFSQVSFEGRANHRIERAGAALLEHVEDASTLDVVAFFEGFAQGARATVQLAISGAEDPHHAWEAAFRAFARALRAALAPNPRRAGRTAGVKGTLD